MFFFMTFLLSFLLILGVYTVSFMDFSSSTQTLNMGWVLFSVVFSHFILCLQQSDVRFCISLSDLYPKFWNNRSNWLLILSLGCTMIFTFILHSFIICPYTTHSASYFWSSLRTLPFIQILKPEIEKFPYNVPPTLHPCHMQFVSILPPKYFSNSSSHFYLISRNLFQAFIIVA